MVLVLPQRVALKLMLQVVALGHSRSAAIATSPPKKTCKAAKPQHDHGECCQSREK
jgi:hypothetical protein